MRSMDTILAIPSEALLDAAQRVFGKLLVTGAWITSTHLRVDSTDVKEMSWWKERYTGNSKCEISLFDAGGEIMLEFCNGRRVCFSTSEWAHINPPDGIVRFVDYDTNISPDFETVKYK